MNKVEMIQQTLAQIDKDIKKRVGRGYTIDDFEMYSFNQIWSGITPGYNDEDDASVLAMTYVLLPTEKTGLEYGQVYFEDKFAYEVNPNNKNFRKDLATKKLVEINDSSRYQ